ncbi:hypothetical protein [Rubellimicrobium roseum]|uniref:Uncharacterized protein n=1 Tax=Rubellimicrobium roseum TaxID=687525 RepID=A0A5C4NB25_9RHOB|nr:hypothetical protein [Rubellimicrobium roseum]TNC61830.1 hypothetical protein FHG71_20835 [Rubellimicrobium roseum]
MTWSVCIREAQSPNGDTIYDVIAMSEAPTLDEIPDVLVCSHTNRRRAIAAARRFVEARRQELHEPKVIPFPKRGRAA